MRYDRAGRPGRTEFMMTLRTALVLCAAALAIWVLSLIVPERVYAQDSNEGLVAVGGLEILRIRASAPGMTVADRAGAVQERLVTILADPGLRPSDITTVPSGKDQKLLVKGQLLVTVTRRDAEFNKTTTRQLADIWAKHVRAVLPQVNVRPNPGVGAEPVK
jgi:hypothetical protein